MLQNMQKTELIDDENKRHYCIGDYWEDELNYGIVYQINDDYGYSGNVVVKNRGLFEKNIDVLQSIRSVKVLYWVGKILVYFLVDMFLYQVETITLITVVVFMRNIRRIFK